MDFSVVFSQRTHQSSRVPVSLGVFRGVAVVATVTGATNNKDILVHCLQNGNQTVQNEKQTVQNGDQTEAIVLNGHHECVTTLSFSKPRWTPCNQWPALLCSASASNVLLWDMEAVFNKEGSGTCYKHLTCMSADGGVVNHVCFSHDVRYVALCRGQEVIICNTQSCDVDTTLVGHTASVTCSVFSPHHRHTTIITASEDRTFKVWDLESSCLLYQSPIVSGSPFLCLDVGYHLELFVTGTADGIVRVFDLSEGGGYQCLLKCDITKELDKTVGCVTGARQENEVSSTTIRSLASWQGKPDHMTEDTPTSSVDVDPAILSVYYCPSPHKDQELEDGCVMSGVVSNTLQTHIISDLLRAPPTLIAVTHTNLLQFNALTLQLTNTIDLTECVSSVTAVADMTFDPNESNSFYCGLGALFSSSATVLRVSRHQSDWQGQTYSNDAAGSSPEDCGLISVLSSTPLAINSPLKAELTLKNDPVKGRQKQGASGYKKRGESGLSGMAEKPLTFKNKVKSSGYTEAPRMKLFTPSKMNSTRQTMKQLATAANDIGGQMSRKQYPRDCDPVSHLGHTLQLTDRPTPINSCSFSGSGQYLTCACADRNAYAVRMPPSLGRTHAFVGHNDSVLSATWSHSGSWLLTCSKDKSARLWSLASKDSLVCIDRTLHNFKGSESHQKTNRAFSKEITAAQFYYLDKFILLTTSNSLCMYKFFIDTDKPDDIKRYQSNTRYKLVTSLMMEKAQSITAMSCINDFHSYIVLVTGSNKTVEVFDMNVERSIRQCSDVHSRPVHCLQQNKGSRFISHPPALYDLYLTAAVTDGVKLWDLRTNRCVSRYASHLNQAHSVSATFSPCGRFIASGSEDKAAYIYDIRSSAPLHKLKGHLDVVSRLAYHPLNPTLATTSLMGTVKFFNNDKQH